MAELAVRMKTSTSIAGSKGFTLVELLVVLLIIGIATSFVTLSINTAKPSQAQTLFNQLQNQLRQSQQEAQLKNIYLRVSIKSNLSEVQRLNPANQQWLPSKAIAAVKWSGVEIESSQQVINIFPNGYTTPTILNVTFGNESYQINIE